MQRKQRVPIGCLFYFYAAGTAKCSNMLLWVLLLFLVTTGGIFSLDVPSCIRYVAEPENLCGAYVNYQFVLPTNSTQSDLDLVIKNKYTAASILPFMSPECQVMTHRFMCSMIFQPCDESMEAPTPLLPCRSLCEAAVVTPGDFTKTCNVPLTEYSHFSCDSLPTTNCNAMDLPASDDKVIHVSQVYSETGMCAELMPGRGVEKGVVFVPPTLSMEAMETRLHMATRPFPIWLDTACLTEMRKIMCAQVFMPAQVNTMGMTEITLPRLPSRSLCMEYNAKCGAFANSDAAKSFGNVSILLDCHSTYPMDHPLFAGLPKYPLSSTLFLTSVSPHDDAMATTLVNSYDETTEAVAFAVMSDCPPPLVYDSNPDAVPLTPSGCSIPCPSLVDEFENIKTRGLVTCIFSIVSMGCALIMLMYYVGSGLWGKRTKVIWLLVSSCNFNWIIAVESGSLQFSRDDIITCASPGVAEGGHSLSACTVFSYMTGFFTIATCCWWLCTAIELFFKVVRQVPDVSLAQYNKACHMFCWGMSFLCSTVIASLGFLGHDVGVPLTFCFVRANVPASTLFAVYFAPVMCASIIGGICVARVIWYIFQTSKQIAPTKKTDNSSSEVRTTRKSVKKRKTTMYHKPVLFVVLFCLMWGTGTIGFFKKEAEVDRKTAASDDFVRCLLESYNPSTAPGNLHLTSDYCGATPGDYGARREFVFGPPRVRVYLVELLLASQGLLYFLIFGLDKNVIKYYAFRLGLSSDKPSSSGGRASNY